MAVVTFAISVVLFLALAVGLLFVRLSQGPIAVASLESPVVAALTARVGQGFKVGIGGTDIESVDGNPALAVKQLLIRDEAGRPIVKAPRAVISVDPLQLLGGAIVPTRLDMRDIILKLSILPDGDLALSAGSDDTVPLRLSEAIASTAAPTPDTTGSTEPSGPVPAVVPPEASSQPPAITKLASLLASAIDQFTGVDNAMQGFDRFGVARGTLILDDRTHNAVTSFKNLDLDFQKVADGSSHLTIAADGPSGRWSISLRGMRHADARRTLSIDLSNVMLDDLRVLPGFQSPGFDTDLSMSGSLVVGLESTGALSVTRGRLSARDGFVRIDDPDHEPLFLDLVEATFHYDVGAKHFLIDSTEVRSGETSYDLSGRLDPPAVEADPWSIAMSGKGTFGAERPGEKPIDLSSIDLAATALPDQRAFSIQKFNVSGPQVSLGLAADVQHDGNGLLVKGSAKAGKMPAQTLLRLWPTPVAAAVRAWLLVNLQGGAIDHGTISFALNDADLAKMKQQRSVEDSHLRVDYKVSDVTLGFMAGVPPLHNVDGSGVVTGDTSKFTVARGLIEVAPGRQLTLADGSLVVPSTDPKPTPAIIAAHVLGDLDGLTALLSRDALRSFANLPPEAANAHGKIDGTLNVGLKLGKTSNEDPKIAATAQIDALVIEKFVGKQDLTDGRIGLVLDKTGLHAKGDARLFDAPTTIDIKKPAGTAPGEATILLTLDDAARIKAGIGFGKGLAGPVTAKVTSVLGTADLKAAVDVDLTKATLNNLLPGLSKSAGKPGRVTLTATKRDNGVALDNVSCDIGSFSLRGAASLDENGGFQSARISQARLSPGDDMKVDANQTADGLKVTVRGINIDARPFLKTFTASDGGADNGAKDIDLDLHSNVMTGQNSQALTNVDLRMAKRGGQVKKLQITGRFGRAPLTVTSSLQGGVLGVTVASSDAGASLAFLDLYKKVNGGKLDVSIRALDTRLDGFATIHDFALREDPAMRRLTEEGITQEKSGDTRIDTSNIAFTKLFVSFNKVGSRVDIKDGGMFGPQMGATVQGSLDLARDQIQLSGTYVPAYGVNNLFSQIPVVGTLLGGGAHEGLFGLNYKISGSIASPNLTVDPLSALAPGFLRKIFGAISDAADPGAPQPQPRSKSGNSDAQAR